MWLRTMMVKIVSIVLPRPSISTNQVCLVLARTPNFYFESPSGVDANRTCDTVIDNQSDRISGTVLSQRPLKTGSPTTYPACITKY